MEAGKELQGATHARGREVPGGVPREDGATPPRAHSPDSQGDRQLMHLSTTFQTWVNVLSSQGTHTVSEVLVHKFFTWWPKETRATVVSAEWSSARTPGSSAVPGVPRCHSVAGKAFGEVLTPPLQLLLVGTSKSRAPCSLRRRNLPQKPAVRSELAAKAFPLDSFKNCPAAGGEGRKNVALGPQGGEGRGLRPGEGAGWENTQANPGPSPS